MAQHDLFRYWLHRLNHTIPFLWRLHAVHHSVEKIYWLNTSRFHPFEKALQFVMDAFPFMLLGVNEEVFALHVILYGVNGFFQHANIDLKFGWLNYLVSSAELHRWHHSKAPEAVDRNFASPLPLWDLLFGTCYFPADRKPSDFGIHEPMARNWIGQMLHPFRKTP